MNTQLIYIICIERVIVFQLLLHTYSITQYLTKEKE